MKSNAGIAMFGNALRFKAGSVSQAIVAQSSFLFCGFSQVR
jgi:hypothetical protein